MTSKKQALGRWGEDLAAEYLSAKDYTIIGRNVRTDYGELDLVARKDGITVFVEVKTRSSTKYGYPEEAITENKRTHLLESAQAFLQDHPEYDGDWRIDVLTIQKASTKVAPEITHFENAIN
jgi:putative endonuclease